MDLLSLSPELVQAVLVQAIISRGVQRGLRLRLVNKRFANEIMRALFASGLLDTWANPQNRSRESFGVARQVWTEYMEQRILTFRVPASLEPQESLLLLPLMQIYTTATKLSSIDGLGPTNNFRANVKALCFLATSIECFRPSWLTTLDSPQVWDQNNLLAAAAYLGHTDLTRDLYRSDFGKGLIFSFPMSAAALGGHISVLDIFLSGATKSGVLSSFQLTDAARLAAAEGHLAAFDLLVDEKWEKYMRNDREFLPSQRYRDTLTLGLRSKSIGVVKSALQKLQNMPHADHNRDLELIVLGASCQGYLEVLQEFLGSDDIISDRILAVGLSCASLGGKTKVVEYLLARGADPNLSMPRGQPLQLAVSKGHLSIARLLLNNGANLNEPGPHSIVQPIKLEYLALFRLLRSHGAVLNTLESGCAALELAYSEGLDSMLELLLQEGDELDEAVEDAAIDYRLVAVRSGAYFRRLLAWCRKGGGFNTEFNHHETWASWVSPNAPFWTLRSKGLMRFPSWAPRRPRSECPCTVINRRADEPRHPAPRRFVPIQPQPNLPSPWNPLVAVVNVTND